MKTICIRSFENDFDANLAKAFLEDNEIDCYLTNENMTRFSPNPTITYGGIKLFVNEEDYEKAKKIFNDFAPPSKDICPNCGSSNIKIKFDIKKILMIIFIGLIIRVIVALILREQMEISILNQSFLISIILFVIFSIFKKQIYFRCNDCNNYFYLKNNKRFDFFIK